MCDGWIKAERNWEIDKLPLLTAAQTDELTFSVDRLWERLHSTNLGTHAQFEQLNSCSSHSLSVQCHLSTWTNKDSSISCSTHYIVTTRIFWDTLNSLSHFHVITKSV